MKKLLSITLLTSLVFSTINTRPLTPNTDKPFHLITEQKESDDPHEGAAKNAFVKVPLLTSATTALVYALLFKSGLSFGSKAMLTMLIYVFGISGVEYLLASKAKNNNSPTRKKRARKIAITAGVITALICTYIDFKFLKNNS
jgi:hypothetical protein